MSTPGFTADASIYAATHQYAARALRRPQSRSVQPQIVLPPWAPCSWLSFCCTEFADPACCRRWHRHCIPE
jgi:hypothetical protein